MLRRPIRRGGIVSAGYDPDRRWLDIEFDTHRVMRYEDVGPETADPVLISPTKLKINTPLTKSIPRRRETLALPPAKRGCLMN